VYQGPQELCVKVKDPVITMGCLDIRIAFRIISVSM
jgi:hypothetical protein